MSDFEMEPLVRNAWYIGAWANELCFHGLLQHLHQPEHATETTLKRATTNAAKEIT